MTKLNSLNIPKKIAVVGSINCDQIAYLEQFPKPNQTIKAKNSALSVGGKGLNQAVSAAQAGALVSMIGSIGNDLFGEMALKHIKASGIDISSIKITPELGTGTATIFVTKNSENMIAVATGANACLSPEDVKAHKAIIENADALIVQLETPLETVREALEIAANAGVTTILNPAPAVKGIEELLKLSTILTPNETEVEALVSIYPKDQKTYADAVAKLRKMGAGNVIITLGGKGVYCACNGEEILIPAYPVKAIDPTGAGDVFNGVLAVALSTGFSYIESSRIAVAAATLSVTRAGAAESAPSWKEIESFLKENNQEAYKC
ncbi:MAG: ribokinase [Kordiimonadaceae bacterium]|nr:ribokinase [Kordiimonadaceae bacterium]